MFVELRLYNEITVSIALLLSQFSPKMTKFGQYLKHNIVPEWRDKVGIEQKKNRQYIHYKGLKKILNACPENRNYDAIRKLIEPVDIEMSPTPSFAVTLHSVEQPKNSFREVDNSSTVGMVDLTGRQVRGDSEGILETKNV